MLTGLVTSDFKRNLGSGAAAEQSEGLSLLHAHTNKVQKMYIQILTKHVDGTHTNTHTHTRKHSDSDTDSTPSATLAVPSKHLG